MKIIVVELKKLSPYVSLYIPTNRLGKMVLALVGNEYFDTTDLYALTKLGFKITRKTHK